MQADIIRLLKQNGPGLTSDFITMLTNEGVSEAAARKRIQRAQGQYERLAGIRFSKNARFIYLPDQYGDYVFWEKFKKACYQSGKAYWTTFVLLQARGGLVRKEIFSRITSSPASRMGQLSPARVLERLTSVNLLEELVEGDKQYIKFRPRFLHQDSLAEIHAHEIAENIALKGVVDWARKIGLGSFGKFACRFDTAEPLVSGILWDMTAPSYVRPLVAVRAGRSIPGFLVADINLRESIGKDEAEAFIRKCDMAAAPQKVPPIMPLLVGHVFDNDAFSLLKSKGILAVSLNNIFGTGLATALRELVVLLTDLGSKISGDPEILLHVFNTLSQIKGATDNLLGDLFELVIGSLVKDVEGGYLKTGERRVDPQTGRHVEIDVQLDRGKKHGVLVLECKAKNPSARVSEAEIRKWYSDRVPLIYSILSNGGNYTDKPFRFELWTNGEFTHSGLQWLKSQQSQFGHHSIGWKEGRDLKQFADRAKNKSLNEMLNQHYFRSPLKKAISR